MNEYLDEDSEREAASVSSCIAFNTLALLISLFLKFAIPSSPYIFATVSNIGYVVCAVYIHYRATSTYDSKYQRGEFIGDSYLIANISTSASIFFILLGASSLGFHSESVLFQPLHSFDILFGWLLILTVAFVSISVSFYAWAGRRLTRQLHSTAFVGFLVAIFMLVVQYSAVYNHQLEYYLVVASVAVVFAVISRIVLTGKKPSLEVIAYAIGEMFILISVAVAAVFCQGELLGKKLNRELEGESYDLFHGVWHLLLSSVCSIILVRGVSVARMVENEYTVCVCKPSLLDIAGEVSLFVFSVTAVALKEMGTSNATSLVVLFVVSLGLCVHATFTAFRAW